MIKYNSEYNNILKEICERNPTSYMNILKSTKFAYVLNYVKSCVSGFLDESNASFGKMLYWVLHEFQDFPICANPNCHNHVIGRKNIRFNKKWPMYCSNKCAQSDIKTLEHKKQTNTRRYGNPNFNGNREELKKHNRERYGVDWYFQSKEFTVKKQITWEKNGYDHPMHSSHIKEGMRNRYYEKHGVEYSVMNPDVIKKSRSNYFYDNRYFKSSWELAYYIYLMDHNIDFEYQPSTSFEYTDGNEKTHRYYPDFKVDGKYIEIKGDQFIKNGTMFNPFDNTQETNHVYDAKFKCIKENNVELLCGDDMNQYIQYCCKKYGTCDWKLLFKTTNGNIKVLNLIRTWVTRFPRSYFKKIKAKANQHILRYIEDHTPLLNSPEFLISTKVYWILNNITEFPKCVVCGKEIRRNIKINEKYPTHCSNKCLSMDPVVQKHKEDAYERKYGNGIVNPFQSKEVIDKIDQTNLRKYGVKRFTQTNEFRNLVTEKHDATEAKKIATHSLNNSFNDSKPEVEIFNLIRNVYPDVKRHFSSKSYPFSCDFYIPSTDTYVEYNGTWTHGKHPFNRNNPDDVRLYEAWRDKRSKYYDNAIYVWTNLDVRKRECAKQNNLKFVELWNVDDVIQWLNIDRFSTLIYPYNQKKMSREFEFYKTKEASTFTPYVSRKNEIVKYFQQDTFFKTEKEMWKNDQSKRNRLIRNRMRYLDKEEFELTVDDILTGFKKSGIHYGYSHFNPLWFKWFITEYGIQNCYDPCGGWGHRLLGGLNLEKYIYNDFSPSTKANVDRIIDHFKVGNAVTYCNDASTFMPSEDFDAMFTCPPYFNLEKYECGSFLNRVEFDKFISSLFDVFKKKETCNLFGIVIREDLLGDHTNFIKKMMVNPRSENYLDGNMGNFNEYLYVFSKNR